MIDAFLGALARANLAGGLAILVVMLMRRPARRMFGAAAGYALWALPLLVALAVLAPPPPIAAPAGDLLLLLPAAPTFEAVSEAASVRPDHFTSLLALAWAVGATGWALALFRRQAAFLAEVRRGRAGPALVGVLRPRIVTPADFASSFSADQREMILAHEACHLARGDTAVNGLTALILCLCWFNPIVHLGARRLRIDQELACDAAVLRDRPQARRTYAETLLKAQIGARSLPFGCAWPATAPHPLKERIAMLKTPQPSSQRHRVGLVIVAVAAASAALGAWAAQPRPEQLAAGRPAKLATDIGLRQPETSIALESRAAQPGASGPVRRQVTPAGMAVVVTGDGRSKLTPVADLPPRPPRTPVDLVARGAAEPPTNVVVDPVWLEKPTGADIARLTPPAVLRTPDFEGRATMACEVGQSGRLTRCMVMGADMTSSELEIRKDDPPGMGLPQAMLELSKLFRMAPNSQSGAPTAGKTVVIPVRWQVSEPPAA